jgi:hypothetical protein
MPKKKFDRRKMKQELLQRTKESYETKDDSGMFRTFFNQSKLTEVGAEFWSCGEGSHRVDLIPFIAGRHHPRVEEGRTAYNLDIWVHRGVGATEDAYVCPLKNYGNPCPICEDYQVKKNDPEIDDDVLDGMKAKRRVVYNVVVRDSKKEQREGVKLWEVAHWFVERHIATISRDEESGETIAPADPDEGKTLAFTKEGSGPRSTSFIGHRFVNRAESLTDELLESAYILDELIAIPSYEDLSAAHFGRQQDEEAEEETEEEGTEVEEEEPEEEEEEEPSDPFEDMNRTKLKKYIRDNELNIKVTKSMDDDAIRVKIREAVSDSDGETCPFGHRFGQDTDETSDCDNCEKWSACAEAAEG